MGCGASNAAKPAAADASPAAPTPVASAQTMTPVAPKLDRKQLAKQVFEAMDADSSGSVDLKEFLATAKSAAEEAMELPMMYSFLDSNGDGKLTLEEWTSGLDAMGSTDESFEKEMKDVLQVLQGAKMAREAFIAGEAGNGVVNGADTADEGGEAADDLDDMDGLDDMAAEANPMLEKAKQVFESLDTDGSGTLSKAELRDGLLADPEAKALLGEDSEEAFKRFDLDGDDEITWMEFEERIAGDNGASPEGAEPVPE